MRRDEVPGHHLIAPNLSAAPRKAPHQSPRGTGSSAVNTVAPSLTKTETTARFYTTESLLWQFRIIGGIVLLGGILTAFSAF